MAAVGVDADEAEMLAAMGLVVGAPVMLARQGEPCIVAVLSMCPARAAESPHSRPDGARAAGGVAAELTRSGVSAIGPATGAPEATPSTRAPSPAGPAGSCSCRIGLARGLARRITVAPAAYPAAASTGEHCSPSPTPPSPQST